MPRSGADSAVTRHLASYLGAPSHVLAVEVHKGARIEVLRFADVPADGQVTLATDGLARFSRENGFARHDGYAQEMLLVVDSTFMGERLLDFFRRTVAVYLKEGELLNWETPVRLSSPIPGSKLRFILPAPAAVFDEGLQFVIDDGDTTNFVLLLPLHDAEAQWVLKSGPVPLFEELERQDAYISDLQRPVLRGLP